MVAGEYREANELTDLLDFYEIGGEAGSKAFADLIPSARADLAEQERNDRLERPPEELDRQ